MDFGMEIPRRGSLLKDGTETDETGFMHAFFKIHDHLYGTNLDGEYKQMIEVAKTLGQQLLDWSQLHPHMAGVEGTGYSATITWISDTLRNIAPELDDQNIGRLWSSFYRFYERREDDMKRFKNPNVGHIHAFKKWKEVKEVLDYFNTVPFHRECVYPGIHRYYNSNAN